jgi:ATP-dependent protease ClpP protease subunit
MEINPRRAAMGSSANTAVAILTIMQRPVCAVSMSNHASHRSNADVIIAAGTATWRCLHNAQVVVERQPSRMMSKPVHASGQFPTR